MDGFSSAWICVQGVTVPVQHAVHLNNIVHKVHWLKATSTYIATSSTKTYHYFKKKTITKFTKMNSQKQALNLSFYDGKISKNAHKMFSF